MFWWVAAALAGPNATVTSEAMGGNLRIIVRCESAFWHSDCLSDGVAARSEVERIEAWATDWRKESTIGALNETGNGELPEEIVNLLTISTELNRATHGAFDVTGGGLWHLWGFDPPRIPTEAQRLEAVASVRGEEVRVEGNQVFLPTHSQITLGGIAQGYAASAALARIPKKRAAMVDVSGDIAVRGRWTIGIQHPRADSGLAFAQVGLRNAVLSTSGDYEHYFEADGQRYHHILDPKTGLPAYGAISATVVHPDGALADALATALIVLGPDEAVVSSAGAWALVVTPDLQIHELGRRGKHVTSVLRPDHL